MSTLIVPSRRLFLASAALPLFTVRGAFANLLDDLTKTPAQTEGPFYPDKLPLDTDNDLLVINDSLTPGIGEITHLTGRVLDVKGNPVKNTRTASVTPLTFKPIFRGTLLPAATSMLSLLYGLKPDRLAATE